MRIFLDCNVLLDVSLQREPFYHTSSQLLDYLETHKNTGCIAWHSLATFYYIAAKSKNKPLVLHSRNKSDFLNLTGLGDLSGF